MDLPNLFVFCAFVVNFFLSLLIHFRTQRTPARIAFEIAAFAMTGWCLAMLFFRGGGYLPLEVWTRVMYACWAVIPGFLLLFALFFPKDKVDKKIIGLIVAVSGGVVALTVLSTTVVEKVEPVVLHDPYIYFGWAYYYIYLVYIFFFLTLVYYIFLHKYDVYARTYRVQIVYILFGTAVASFAAITTHVVLPAFGIFDLSWIGQVATVVWVGSVAYAVINHRLMDVRIFAARAIVYTIIVSILGGIYATGIFLVGLILLEDYSSDTQFAVLLLLTLFITVTLQPLKKFIEKVTNDIFFRDRYDSHDLLARLGAVATSTLNLSSMVEMLLQELLVQMKPSFVILVVIKNGKFFLVKNAGEINQKIPDISEGDLTDTIEHIAEHPENVLTFDYTGEDMQAQNKVQEKGVRVLIPLMVKGVAVGVLMLGEKSSGDMYTPDDLKMFKILSSEIAVAINNSLSYEEIVHFNETLEQKVHHATANLERANKRLKELDRVKDEFVSVASHELRTPLTVIRSYLWMLLQNKAGKVSAAQKKYLEHAFTTSERLIDLVNDMLSVARIEAGRLNLVKVENDITGAVKNVIIGMSLRAKELSIQLTYVQKQKKIPKIEIDSEKIEQVVINLIGNSLKFTPAGGKITVALNHDKEKKEIIVSVTDTGIGISKENQTKLFQKFTSAEGDYHTRNNAQSTGLGLYISRSIVKMHGGNMWAESDGEGKGATFYFSIPVK